jgi:hypothetical protein
MNDEERAAYDFLTQGHAMARSMGVSDAEACRIASTAGDIPAKAMREYLDDHDEPYPFWCVKSC